MLKYYRLKRINKVRGKFKKRQYKNNYKLKGYKLF